MVEIRSPSILDIGRGPGALMIHADSRAVAQLSAGICRLMNGPGASRPWVIRKGRRGDGRGRADEVLRHRGAQVRDDQSLLDPRGASRGWLLDSQGAALLLARRDLCPGFRLVSRALSRTRWEAIRRGRQHLVRHGFPRHRLGAADSPALPGCEVGLLRSSPARAHRIDLDGSPHQLPCTRVRATRRVFSRATSRAI